MVKIPELLEQKVKLQKKGLTLIVEYDKKSNKEWAEYLATMAEKILIAYEKAFGVDFQTASKLYYSHLPKAEQTVIKVVGQEQILLNGNWIGAYNNTSGIFGEPRGIFLQYNLTPIGNPAVIFHELGHFWFYRVHWFSEGLVSFVPWVLDNLDYLDLVEEELNNIGKHWGFKNIDTSGDKPVIEDFRKDVESVLMWYKKTFKIQYLLHHELGDDLYFEFLKKALSFNEKSTTEDILAILNAIKKQNWKDFLSGWVFPGKYKIFDWTFFKDL